MAGGAGFKIVAIGASAGGLKACTKLLEALPVLTGMAFILVQHLDPTHESMLVDLLTKHTVLTVVQAMDGMPVEPEHLYVIPPASYLSVSAGILCLSAPKMRDGALHGARLPFNTLLHSLAEEYGQRAACVVLSGTGDDGSAGLRAVKEGGGLVVAQNPDEAGYDGMPRSAIATGLVDAVFARRRCSRGVGGRLGRPRTDGYASPGKQCAACHHPIARRERRNCPARSAVQHHPTPTRPQPA